MYKRQTDYNDKNFIELIRVDNGELKKNVQKPDYGLIKDYFAKRTFEESGNYALDKFKVEVVECLSDGISNEGIYDENQETNLGNEPGEDLMCVKVSPGKAYVRGYDIEKPSTTIIDVDKPRDKEELTSQKVNFSLGSLFKLNNVHGTPNLGLNQSVADSTVTFRSERKGSGNDPAEAGTEIGRARIYTFENTDASYTGPTTKFDLYLFDIQLYTTLTIAATSTDDLPIGSFIEGLSSGASGFTNADAAGSGTIKLDQVSGTFIRGEKLRINGSIELPDGTRRSVGEVTRFGLEDVLSVHQNDSQGTGIDFSGDLVLKKQAISTLGVGDVVNITAVSSSESNMTASGRTSVSYTHLTLPTKA